MTRCLHQRIGRTIAMVGVLALAAGGAGCATTRTVHVDSTANPAAPPGFGYAIDPSSPALASGGAAGAAVVERVRLALSQRGLFEAESTAQADMVVRVEYGERKEHTKVERITEPVVVHDPLAIGPSSPAGGGLIGPASYPGGRYPSGSQVVYTETTRIARVSEKYIRISATENSAPRERRAKPPEQLWAVEAAVEDEAESALEVVPVLVDAATEYIGVSTGAPVTVKVAVQ